MAFKMKAGPAGPMVKNYGPMLMASPAKNILTIPKGADGGLSKGSGKDADARRHNQRHADGLPADHGVKKTE